MTARKLVSIVTGTWQRHELLMEAIETIRAQTYRPLEHVIVSDGPDPELRKLVEAARIDHVTSAMKPKLSGLDRVVPITFVELGRNWSSVLTDSMSAVPFGVANWLAKGDYQCWLADDERMTPDHVESLVDLLEEKGVDFVYPLVELYWNGRPEKRWTIGTDPPRSGNVTHALHKTELLDVVGGGFRVHVGSMSDWDQFERWMAAGKTWAMLDRVTLTHRVDK